MLSSSQPNEPAVDDLAAMSVPYPLERGLSVILPVFNEAGTVVLAVGRALAQPLVAELLVIDDCSNDGSWELLNGHPGLDPRLRLFRQPVNRGKGAAIRAVLQYVSARWVVILDADLEYDPADFSAMLEPLSTGQADVVYGSRFLRGERVSGLRHRAINWGLTCFANAITGLSLTDVHTCLKMFPSQLLKGLPLREERFGFCPETTALLARIEGLRLVEVPVSYKPRSRRSGKKLRMRDGARALYCILRYSLGSFQPALAK